MSYQFSLQESLADAFQRVHREQVNKALGLIERAGQDPDTAVHEVRKVLKRLRGLLRLGRDVPGVDYAAGNRVYRDLGRRLSARRDARAQLEFLAQIEADYGNRLKVAGFRTVRGILSRQYEATAGDAAATCARLEECREPLLAQRAAVEEWSLEEAPAAVWAKGPERTYRRARKALSTTRESPAPEAFHEWRKRVKYLRYGMRLVRCAWYRPLNALRKELRDLGNLLGEEHDLSLLLGIVRAHEEEFAADELAVLGGLLHTVQLGYREAAQAHGEAIFCESPEAFADRLGHYLETRQGRDEARAFRHGALEAAAGDAV
ncbi:MAG: CHAD domain-containing protein [Opitutales bacterium]